MRIFRAIVWSEEVVPDNHPQAAPGAVRVIRSREVFFISDSKQAEAVKQFQANIGKLGAQTAC